MSDLIKIDGSEGEGGGQIIRSALALSAVTGKPFEVTNIRGKRKRPGLLKQHLTGVKAAREVCNGAVEGAELNSSHLVFAPGNIIPRDFRFQIGTAGSTTLVAQTVLPALMTATGPSRVTVEGGTHNMAAPPYDFIDHCYLPQLEKMGPKVQRKLERHGFFPAGGGKIVFDIQPVPELVGLHLTERGGKSKPHVRALVSQLPIHIGERECDVIRRKSNWNRDQFEIVDIKDSPGPGNVLMIRLDSPNVSELFTGFGKRGLKAENLARATYREAKRHLDSEAPVGEYLADQLLLPMGLAARSGHTSAFVTDVLSMHTQTHIEILKRFLDIQVRVTKTNNVYEIVVEPFGS